MSSHRRVSAISTPLGRARAFRAAMPLTLGLAAAGCTHLAITPDRVVGDNANQAVSGVPYSLPMLQYEMKISRTLTACPEVVELPAGDDGRVGKYRTDGTQLALGVTATGALIPGERYRVDYSKLDSAFKTTSFAIEYQTGSDLLKSVNVSVEDHTGEVIANTVKAGLAATSVLAGPPGVVAAAELATAAAKKNTASDKANFIAKIAGLSEVDKTSSWKAKLAQDAELRRKLIALVDSAAPLRPIFVCSAPTSKKVERWSVAAKEIKDATKKLKDLTAEVDQYTKIATIKALSSGLRKQLSDKAVELVNANLDLETKKKTLAEMEEALGVTQSVTWPTQFSEYKSEDLAPLAADDLARLTGLFDATPEQARVIDPNALASALAASPDLSGFRSIAEAFVAKYVDQDGAPKRFLVGNAPSGCDASSSDLKICIASLAHLRAALVEVASDDLARCAEGDLTTLECRRRWSDADKVEAAKQEAAKARNDYRRSALPRKADARTEDSHAGLFVRPPVRAQLLICRAPSATEGEEANACAQYAVNLVKDDKVLAPQLGQLRYFRLVNQAFSNNALVLNLSKDGAIEKFQYSSSKAIAQGLTASLADAATQAAAFDKQRREEAEKNSNPLTALQNEIALKTAQQTLAAFGAVKSPSQLEQLQIDKARADVALSEAQRAFTAAQTAILTSKMLDP